MNLRDMPMSDLLDLRRLLKNEMNRRRSKAYVPHPVLSGVECLAAMPSRIRLVVIEAAREHGMTPEELCSPRRTKALTRARWAVWAAFRSQGYSYPQIAIWFAKDHSTVMHGAKLHDTHQVAA